VTAPRHRRGAVERINALCVVGACLPLLGAMYAQFAGSDLPCPLCLLQRMAFLGIGIGCALNLKFGVRSSHYAIVLMSAMVGAATSIRQVLLHIEPGDPGYGGPVFGIHLYTWTALLCAFTIVGTSFLMLFDGPRPSPPGPRRLDGPERTAVGLLVAIAAANVILAFAMCGFGPCPDDPKAYWLFGGGG
jgi:hypothetical protein